MSGLFGGDTTDFFAGLFGARDPLEGKLNWDEEALDFLMRLAHPDRHPPELQDIANRASATVIALRRYALDRIEKEKQERERWQNAQRDASAKPSGGTLDGAVTADCWVCGAAHATVPVRRSEGFGDAAALQSHCPPCAPLENEEATRRRRERVNRRVDQVHERLGRLQRTAAECWQCSTPLTAAVWRVSVPIPELWHRREVAPHCETCGKAAWAKVYFDCEQRQTQPCQGDCGRAVTCTNTRGSVWACSERCAAIARRRLRREHRNTTTCETCGEEFTPTRSDSRYHSNACRQRAYRKRKEAAG